MLLSRLTPNLPHSPIKTFFFQICHMPCPFRPSWSDPFIMFYISYISVSCCLFSLPPHFLFSFHLLLSLFLSYFLHSCISVLSFPLYVLVVMLSWFLSFLIHNVSSSTITPFSQCVLFTSRSQTIQDSKRSIVSNTTLCFRFWLSALQSFVWVLTPVRRVCGDTCTIHAQQIDHVSGLVLFLSVGNIALTITSLEWKWGHKCGRVDLEKEITTGTWRSNPITTFCYDPLVVFSELYHEIDTERKQSGSKPNPKEMTFSSQITVRFITVISKSMICSSLGWVDDQQSQSVCTFLASGEWQERQTFLA